MQKLTHSSMQTFKRCARQYQYKYVHRLTRDSDSRALRMGSAFHQARALWREDKKNNTVRPMEDYIAAAASMFGPDDELDQVIVTTLLRGYFWRYADDNIMPIEVEQPFEVRLINPETGYASTRFVIGGKRDEYGSLDGREYVVECKTSSEDISDGSAYWQRLRIDAQISLYFIAARQSGLDPVSVIYDVIRKPTIQPRQIPELDDAGLKIVTDANGERVFKKDGSPRQSAGEGMTLLSRTETPKEFGERLYEDIMTRPDFYFARREIPRLESDLDEYRFDCWQTAQMIATSENRGLFPRHVGRHCDWCEYADLCMNSITIDDNPPSGYTVREALHPELEGN